MNPREYAEANGLSYKYMSDDERRKRVRYDLRWPGIEDDRLRFKRNYRPGVKVEDYSEREDMRPEGPPRECSGICVPRKTITHNMNFCTECNARFGDPNHHPREEWQSCFESAMVREGYSLEELRCASDPKFNILQFLAQTDEALEDEQRTFDEGAYNYGGTVEIDAAGWTESDEDGDESGYYEEETDDNQYENDESAADYQDENSEVLDYVMKDFLVGRVVAGELTPERLQEIFELTEREFALVTCGNKRWSEGERTEFEELADTMELTYANARQIRSRALRRIRQQLGDIDIHDMEEFLREVKLSDLQ